MAATALAANMTVIARHREEESLKLNLIATPHRRLLALFPWGSAGSPWFQKTPIASKLCYQPTAREPARG